MSKEEYETCRITNPSPRLIAICDKPYEDKYYTITFRPFTPQPGGLEFLPGHDYYFISTSSKEDLHRRIGGRCTSDNMKVVFKVCCSNDTSSSSATSRNNCEYCMGIREKKMKKKPNFQRMSLRGCFQSYNYLIKKPVRRNYWRCLYQKVRYLSISFSKCFSHLTRYARVVRSRISRCRLGEE